MITTNHLLRYVTPGGAVVNAMVIEVRSPETMLLLVYQADGSTSKAESSRDENLAPGTWHWPPREE